MDPTGIRISVPIDCDTRPRLRRTPPLDHSLPPPPLAVKHALIANMMPVLLFVHGAWHTPKHLASFRALAEARGYETRCPALPSVGGAADIGLHDDAEAVVEELAPLLARGADVLVIAHSYGGVVVSQAVVAEHGKAARAERGLSGGVVHLLYLCAYVPPHGKSLTDMASITGLPPLTIDVSTLIH
jgi:pimeloyl-ACP methyl ester carboxylesterase